MILWLSIIALEFGQGLPIDSLIEESIKKRIHQFHKRERIASISMSVFKGRNAQIDFAFGYADINKPEKATPEHLYPLASITKPLTASLFLFYADQQNLTLSDSVYHFVDEYPKDVTFAELLTHTSGFFRNKAYDSFKSSSYTDIVNYLPPRWKKNKKHRYRYNNINYATLGAALSEMTSVPYANLMKNYFESTTGDPIHFVNDTCTIDLGVKTYLRRGRRRYPHKSIESGLWEPAALAQTSSKAYARFMRHHMTPRFIERITSHKSFVKKRRFRDGRTYKEYYGLGFRLGYINDELEYIYHNGFVYGSLSTFYYFPKYDVGYVALSNMTPYPRPTYAFSSHIRRIVETSFDFKHQPRIIPTIEEIILNPQLAKK